MPFYRSIVLEGTTRERMLADPNPPLPDDLSALRTSLIDLERLLTPSADE
jgi:hypothetical protein